MQDELQNISPIKQRILYFVGNLGISKREFYEKTGISRGTLESKTGITEDTITKFFAAYPEINPIWLLTGRGEISVPAKCPGKMSQQNVENVPPIVPPNEKDTFNPSDPKFTANFSADDESNACPLCVEKERLISALNEIIRSKDATIRTKDEVIRCQNEYIDKLSEKREGEIPASAS